MTDVPERIWLMTDYLEPDNLRMTEPRRWSPEPRPYYIVDEAYLTGSDRMTGYVRAEVTDEMVERAARALAKADGYIPDALEVGTDYPEQMVWSLYEAEARAALDAALAPPA